MPLTTRSVEQSETDSTPVDGTWPRSCDRCCTPTGAIHLLDVVDPAGQIAVCADCEDDLLATIQRVVDVVDPQEGTQ